MPGKTIPDCWDAKSSSKRCRAPFEIAAPQSRALDSCWLGEPRRSTCTREHRLGRGPQRRWKTGFCRRSRRSSKRRPPTSINLCEHDQNATVVAASATDDDGVHHVTEKVGPMIAGIPDNGGAYFLLDRDQGRALTLTLANRRSLPPASSFCSADDSRWWARSRPTSSIGN